MFVLECLYALCTFTVPIKDGAVLGAHCYPQVAVLQIVDMKHLFLTIQRQPIPEILLLGPQSQRFSNEHCDLR